ncbi:hypothetical protein TREMEDRAFT_10419, partial [Tremella mesenterica DSM 1558]|uniref:uncharacterized protein n=1 Tax=Tremella mesenterica (strain ATCC 24925 / CBS 8224 / DSM 1558 / NBRC 9311 / NRRL Y-6157 / RJB 2259-6 / UBC 559-6) TaxID=578456 RepID=UPI0003F48C3B
LTSPELDDLDDFDHFGGDYPLPPFTRTGFGQSSSPANSDVDLHSHHSRPSIETPYFGGKSPSVAGTPARPTLPKLSGSYSGGAAPVPDLSDRAKLGKFSNGSTSSLITSGTSISSTAGVLAPRKGSLASLRNAFKVGSSNSSANVPPVPSLDVKAFGAPGYPALRNPFSKYDTPQSPANGFGRPSTGRGKTPSASSPGQIWDRKQSTATTATHSSVTSHGGRSVTSQGSNTFRNDDFLMPALPPIPLRGAPSRAGRHGSESGSLFGFGRRHGSIGEELETGPKTPADQAMRAVLRDFKESANAKISRICSRPLTTNPSLSAYLDSGADTSFDALISALAQCGRRTARRVVDSLGTWCKAHCEGIGASEVRAHLDRSLGLQMRVEDAAAILGSRKSAAARFILNRCLIELVRVCPREALGEELGNNLELNAFNAYRSERLDESASPHRKAVSQLQVELLGQLSQNRFLTVSHRFVTEISRHITQQPSKDSDARLEHLLRGMRHLKIRTYPEEELEMSAELLQSLAGFFANAHGQNLKTTYVDTFLSLLHPVVETATAEVNHPMWSKAISVILQRAQGMAAKPRYWNSAFPLVIVALGLSPREAVMQSWQTCMDAITAKLRVKFTGEFLRDALRQRASDSADSSQVDRATALVRASLLTLRTMELEKPAIWPQSSDFTTFSVDGSETSGEALTDDLLKDSEVESFMTKCGPVFGDLLLQTDRQTAHLLLSNDTVTLSAHASSSITETTSTTITRKHGDVYVTYSLRSEPVLRLLAALFDSLPRCLPETDFGPVANVLCRGMYSADPDVCIAAANAIRRIGKDPARCLFLANTYREFVFETRHVFRDTFMGSRLLESQFERVVKVYIDLLQSLVHHQRVASAQESEDGRQEPPVVPALIDKIEGSALFLLCSTSIPLRKLAIQVLNSARDLESTHRRPSAAFRYSRIMPERSSVNRVVQIFEFECGESELQAMRSLPWCTSNDRHRLDLMASDRSKLVLRVAESDNQKDASLWLALLPYIVSRLAGAVPGPIKELRHLVVSISLRLQGHVASLGSLSAGRATVGLRSQNSNQGVTPGRSSGDTSALAEMWRCYLSVLCITMPTPHSVPSSPPVQRTKEAIILTPDTIGSPALFHYLTSLLGWEDPRFRDAAVYALGSIGQTLLRPLSEILLGVVRRLGDGTKGASNGRDTSRRIINGPVWTSVAHVFRLISPLIHDSKSPSHHANLSCMIGFVKITHTLLSDRVVKEDYELQSLRRSFCVVVENLANALGKLEGSERFLGIDMRGAVFKLCYDWCHVGRRPDVAKARESQTLQAAAEGYRGERDRAQYLDDLQAKTKLLSAAAAEAMAGLCQGKLIGDKESSPEQQSSDVVEPLTVLRWIRGMFTSVSTAHHETGRKALFALLKWNWSCDRLLDEVLHQSFGEGEQFSLASSFFGVLGDILMDGLVQLPVHQIACLALSKLGHPNADIRQRAFQLCFSLCSDPPSRLTIARLLPAMGSAAANVYRGAQKEISATLSTFYANNALGFLAECTTRLSQLEAPRRHATLCILASWMEVIELSRDTKDLSPEHATNEHQALSNLMYLAVRFADDHLEEMREIFVSFAGSGQSHNTTALVKYLFEQGGKRRSPEFVACSQKVIACLAQSAASDEIFDEICSFVEPSAMASLAEADVPPSPLASLANLDSFIPTPSSRPHPFSTGQLALLFAGELLPYRQSEPRLGRQLCTLLHVALIHCDNVSSTVRESCQAVLFQVLRTWVGDTSNVPSEDALAIWSTAEGKVTSIARSNSTVFWKADDVGTQEQAFMAPPKMTGTILKILGVLLPLHPRVRQQWGEMALMWATSCPIRHLACRSFQIFRVLTPKLSARMLSDTLARLSSTIASASKEIQSFNREVLRTFASLTQSLSSNEMSNYPQIFWCATACLTTPFEDEFMEVIELLSHVLDKTNLSDPSVVQHLLSFRPSDWVGPEPHLQSLLLVGLRSSKTAFMTFDLIRRLTSASTDELIDSPTDRLLHGFVSALPWMLHSADVGEPNEELAGMALDLASIADVQGHPSFSRLLTSFARVRFRSKDDFIRQACSLLRDFLPTHALDILTLLLGFVLNANDWMREKSMQVLKLILQYPDARGILSTHGDELLQPLLRLVSTKHSAQALDVLDMPTAPTSHPTETTQLGQGVSGENGMIFGSFTESGWSIPRSKEFSQLTRENVTAVFNTCAIETRAASAHFSVVQFTDLRLGNILNPSQISLDVPSPLNDDNASIGDLVGALSSLNQFFDD